MSEETQQQNTPGPTTGQQVATVVAAVMLALKWGQERTNLVRLVQEWADAGATLDEITDRLGGLVDEAKAKAHALEQQASGQ